MNANRRSSLLIGLAASLAVAGCTSSNLKTNDSQASADNSSRGVAAIPTEAPGKVGARPLMASESWLDHSANEKPLNLKKEHVERLLSLLYRTNAYIDTFDRELDEMVKQAQADPKFEGDPLSTETYAEIQKMWGVYGQGIMVITENYRELLDAQFNSTSPERRQKATELINELHSSLSKLPPEDKIQLQILFRELAEVQAEFKTAARDNTNSRNVASTSVNFNDYVYNDYPRLKKDLARYKGVMSRKAKKAANYKDPELQAYSNISTKGRTPAAKLYPDLGEDGNVIGAVFPVGTWVLTYDDGPKSTTTPTLMDYLSSYKDDLHPQGAPATFFWLAGNVKSNPQVISTAIDRGFSLQNHSWTHANLHLLAKKSENQDLSERERTNAKTTLNHEVIESTKVENSVYAKPIKFFRCPYGACYAPASPLVRKMIKNLGLIHAYWRIDSLDWQSLNADAVFERVKKEMIATKRGVILMHDIHPSTVEASKKLLEYFKEQNSSRNPGAAKIRLMTMDEAVDLVNNGGK